MLLLMAAMLAVSSDPMRVAPRGVRPANNPGSWIGPDDYPKAALRAGAAGVTGFVLQVGPDGLVKDCFVTQASGNDGLDATACALLGDRARFLPALDAAGRPISSTYRSSVRWQIPVAAPPILPVVPMSASVDFDVSPEGHPSNCKANGSVAVLADAKQLDAFCKGLMAGMVFQPPVGVTGKPMSKHVAVRLDVNVSDLPPRIDTPSPRP